MKEFRSFIDQHAGHYVIRCTILCVTLLAWSVRAADPDPTTVPRQAPEKAIALIGDSITHGGKWELLIGRPDVLNWGIPGYTTGQLAWTFKDIVREHPSVHLVFLNGGINDLSLGVPVERIYENQVKAIAWWREQHAIPVIESTILQANDNEVNAQITQLNARLRSYCAAHDVDFIDLNAVLAQGGRLRSELSTDGTHLVPDAYPLWASLIREYLSHRRSAPVAAPTR